MQNLKDKLIKKLGGYTKEEYNQGVVKAGNTSYFAGNLSAYDKLKTYAEKLYGTPPEKWCSAMYKEIVAQYKSCKLVYDTTRETV